MDQRVVLHNIEGQIRKGGTVTHTFALAPGLYYCRADHYSYARYGIPAVSLSRGEHLDYHQVTDEAQYIDYEAPARVATLVADVATEIGNLDHRPLLDQPKRDPAAPCVQ